jgi:nicotinamide-nucleotide adenylyltransferase
MKSGLMMGRFQPFHNGHLNLAHQILENCDELIIAIGSSQFNYTFSNPFTAGERIHLIHDSLIEEKIDLKRVYIIPILNLENNSIWIQHLRSMVPKFNYIYTGNKFVLELLSGSPQPFDIRPPKFYDEVNCSGTNIRMNIVMNKEWKDLVPNAVYAILSEINGIQRIKVLFETQGNASGEIKQYPDIK